MRRIIAPITVLALAAVCAALFAYRGDIRDAYRKWQRGPVPPAVSREDAVKGRVEAAVRAEPASTGPAAATNAEEPAEEPAPRRDEAVPPSYNLKVIFIPQAPFKIWDEMHEETCEEAAMLMLKAYVDGRDDMTPDEMDAKLKAVVDYETDSYGDYKSTDAGRTVDVMREFLGLRGAEVVPISSIEDVKREIAAGRPVMLPAADKLLKNPNFKNGGPLYHMLLAKGYTGKTVITNDPGTRLGADYAYADDVLWNAIHDWNGGDVEGGAKVMIVVR